MPLTPVCCGVTESILSAGLPPRHITVLQRVLRQRISHRSYRATVKSRILPRKQHGASLNDEQRPDQNLSDIIALETGASNRKASEPASQLHREITDSDDVVRSATAALDAARQALMHTQRKDPSRPDPTRVFGYQQSKARQLSSSSSSAPTRPALRLQRAPALESREPLPVVDRPFSQLDLQLESTAAAERAKTATLPPLQSIVELTSAASPPTRSTEQVINSSVSTAGRQLEDGAGQLADGTKFERTTTEDFGPGGYWLRQTIMRGLSPQGKVEWEERWWEASDWVGMRELGAEKSGCAQDGSSWRETWREAIGFDDESGEPIVERRAHKWARDQMGDSWEEKWGEKFTASGAVTKTADKMGKNGLNVWHEKWGEDYDGSGGCVKYTDKWAERMSDPSSGEGSEHWGENWVEDFSSGSGTKKGETWSVNGKGERYQRSWGEDHFGNGRVRRHGHSTTGEYWDTNEEMDTFYNPAPHFTYQMALDHSPTLQQVPVLPRGNLQGDLKEGGADDL